ncbi:MAG: InlB B-repeat-containing protein [Bacteroidales bacterium]|nr:InlB B-repeat-containing protein [Candidatus Equimonas faecalis]
MVVTYESSTPTARTVTFDAGTNGTCSTNSLTEASAGAGVTLPSCTPHTNYTFVGWSTSSTPTSADAGTAGENYKPSSDCTLYAYYTYQAPAYTVTLGDNSSTLTEAEGGAGVTLPTRSDVGNYTFAGWSETNVSTETTTAPTIIEAGIYNPTSNITLYPVYTRSEGGSTSGWVEVTTDPIEEGDYVILGASSNNGNTHYIMKASISSNRFENSTININSSVTPNTLAAEPTSNCIWHISKPDEYYRIKNGTNYAGGTSSKNQGALLTDSSVDLAKWIISVSDNTIINYGRQSKSDPNNKYLSNNGGYGWATYTLTGGTAPRLFKHETGTTYYISAPTSADPTDASWSVEPASVSVEVGKTATATISTDYDGTLSVSSNATGTATATISDKTITVTGVAAGTTTLTVTGAATSNFNAISKTINVTVTASSATTPAFAYFEETATINVGEILEAKDYCGTIASDAGFDDYSISTAVCSAIGAADGQKISDDYACIYSKVSFKKAGTYVVHVTAPAVEGKYTASEGYITVTVTGPTLYKVTIETPVNGTLIVKHGDDTVNSGDEFEEGEKLQITATPDADYKFRNWQAYDGTTHTFTTSFEWEMSAHDVTLTANFDEIQDYTIAWSVNGKIVKSETLEEGTEVVPVQPTDDLFTAAVPAGVTKVFTGWVTTPTVDAEATPSYVTPAATATKDVTYYAVFATEEEGTGSVDKTAAFNVANYADANNWTNATAYSFAETEELRIDEGHTATTATNNGKYYTTDETWRFYKSEGGSFTVTSLKGDMKSITITFVPKDSSKKWPKLIHNEVEAASGEQITDISGNTAVFSVGGDGGNIGIQNIEVVYVGTGGTTYSDFTTLPYLQLDEANTSIVELADAPCDKVEVTRALKAGNWNTFCLPFSLNEEEIESQLGSDAEVKALSTFDVNDEGTTLILNFGDASEIAAGQPYMVRVQEAVSTITAEGKTINTVTAPVQEFSNDLYNCNFHGNYYYLEGTKNGYVPHSTFIISNNLFYLVNSNVKMKGFRGYIEATEKATGAPVKAMSFTTDAVVTGTLGIQYEGLEDGCIYNLQGLRQSKLQKGINIVNGKKVLR